MIDNDFDIDIYEGLYVLSTYRASGETLEVSFVALQQLLHHLEVAFDKEIESLCMAHDQQLVKSIHRHIHVPAITLSHYLNLATFLLSSINWL